MSTPCPVVIPDPKREGVLRLLRGTVVLITKQRRCGGAPPKAFQMPESGLFRDLHGDPPPRVGRHLDRDEKGSSADNLRRDGRNQQECGMIRGQRLIRSVQ